MEPFADQPRDADGETVYSLYRKGMSLLDAGDFEQAAVPLGKAARLSPEQGSIREALGRALFKSRQFAAAAEEFEAIVERYPVDDYAHFCLGRALDLSGESRRARHHLVMASNLRPDRSDYRIYRDRIRRAS